MRLIKSPPISYYYILLFDLPNATLLNYYIAHQVSNILMQDPLPAARRSDAQATGPPFHVNRKE